MGYFLYNLPGDNVAGTISWAAIASGDPSYLPANLATLTDLDRGNPAKLTINSAGGWYGDAGSAISVPIMVAWHNGDAAQTIKFEAHSATLSNPATVADITTTLTLPAKRKNNFTVKVFKVMTGLAGYGAKRYYRFYFPVPGANNSQNWGLKVWMGSIIRTLDRPLEPPLRAPNQQQVMAMKTTFGYPWSYDLQSAPRMLGGTINAARGTSWADLIAWSEAAAGPVNPILLIPDAAENDAWIARFGAEVPDGVSTQQLDITRHNYSHNPVNVMFTELDAGGPEWT